VVRVGTPQEGRSDGDRAGSSVTRILVVDDHRTFAELLSFALDAEVDLACVGHATTATEGIAAARQLRPDIVLMDLQLPDRDGITAAGILTRELPSLRVLILTAHPSPTEMARAGAAGACGFLAKDGSLTDVLAAIRTATRGSLVLPPSVVARFAAGAADVPDARRPGDASLTPRELDVLRLLGQGQDPRSIARDLGISLHTCRGHVKSVLSKLGVHSQLEAVVVATRTGLIQVGEPV
jgi:DNA-binding NarL/FixJ family response regulator